MKKKYLAIAMAVFSLQVTGCGAINLTDQERNVIAEYIASVLLKHDKTYEPTLQYAVEVKEENKEETKDKTQNQEKEDNREETEENGNNTQGKKPVDSKGNDKTASAVYQNGIGVTSSGYSFYQVYPKNEKAILPLEASAGNTICVVRMKVKNTSSSAKKIDFLTDNYSYQIEVNSKKTYPAIQSLLINDIQYLDMSLKAGQSYDAVITFEIPKAAKNKKMKVLVSKGSKTAEIKIK